MFKLLHPPTAIKTLPPQCCLGPVDPATLPEVEDEVLSDEDIARQQARDEMPAVENMLLLDDFEAWAEKVLSTVAWAYYRSAADHEACMSRISGPFLPWLLSFVLETLTPLLQHSTRIGMLTRGISSGREFSETCHRATQSPQFLESRYPCPS